MKKIRPGYANIKYIYPEDIIRVWVFISFWLSPLAIWKLWDIFGGTITELIKG